VGSKALKDSSDEVATLNKLAKDAPATAKPLRQFLQTLDDRDRAFDKDPRATATAPPKPDPAAANGRGFTGMEGILTFVYWQTLSINQFDGLGHFLRILAIESDCSPYTSDARTVAQGGTPETEKFGKECNSWLGPYQPGVNAPDPTQSGSTSAAKAGRTQAKKKGERRGAGQPEAGPLPGQPDYSQPNPTLPPSVQDLLNGLTGQNSPSSRGPRVPNVPNVPDTPLPQDVDPTQALDYLLGP
jgi:hypothetical protein